MARTGCQRKPRCKDCPKRKKKKSALATGCGGQPEKMAKSEIF
jgi:hypothetical protein